MSKLIPIEELLLPKRVLETLKKTGIMTIEDLKCISDEDLYSLPGIGRKSVREIKEILKFYDINIKSVNTNAKPADKNIITEKFHIRKHFNHNINFILAYISDFIESKLKEREKEILARRLLYSQSLQEIGNYFGITRERVRQLEDKLLQKIHILLNPQDLLQHNIILIDKKELPEEYYLSLEVFKKICTKYHKMNILETQNKLLIVGWKKEKIKKTKREITDLLYKIGLPIEIEKIKEELNKYGFHPFFLDKTLEELKAVIRDEKIVFYQKLLKTTIVELILRRASKPLHFNEVTKIFNDLSGEKTTPHQIENFLQRNENIYIVDKGTFYLKDEIYKDLGMDFIENLREKSFYMLKALGKPSDTVFLLKELKGSINIPENLTSYLLKSILREDKRFEIGRKFEIWLKEFGIEKRTEYEDLILGVLENSENSLSIPEIQEKLKKLGRDIPQVTINMIFNKSDKIIRLDENLYTSIKKINISQDDFEFFKNIAFNLLKEHPFPLSLDFIAEEIIKENQKYQFINRYILYSLYKNTDEFNIISEKLIKLKESTNKFKTYEDIFEYILKKESRPLKIRDLLEIYKSLTNDPNHKINSLYTYLYTKKRFFIENGMVFLKDWKIEDFPEVLFESQSSSFEKKIGKYLFYREYSISSFDPEKEKDKIEEYKRISKEYETNKPSEKEKVLWLKYLVWSRQPIKILKLLNHIDTSNLPEEDINYINSVKEMFD